MTKMTRRAAIGFGAAAAFAPTLLGAEPLQGAPVPAVAKRPASNNVSGLRMVDWRDHFDQRGEGLIIADISARALHYWGPQEGEYQLYPSSIPMNEELTRRGHTRIVRKRLGPDWTPTADMRRRDPSLPAYLPPGPDNPLGTHALYLSWPAYLIHGTHDTRKIGRASSSGCIGLYNQHIAELFARAAVGTRVLLL